MLAFIQVTNQCKMKCRYCFYHTDYLARSSEKRIQFSMNDLLQAISIQDISSVILTGGDPLHDKVFTSSVSLTKELKNLGVIAGLNTSLALKDEGQIDLLADAYPDIVFVSCDSSDPVIHNQQRSLGKETIRSVELLVQKGIEVAINCSLTALNCHLIRETWNFFSDLGVSDTYFNIVSIPSHSNEYRNLSCECLSFEKKKRLADDLFWWAECGLENGRRHHVAMQTDIFLGINSGDPYEKHAQCQAGRNVVVINQNGFVNPCFHPNRRWKNVEHITSKKWEGVADEESLPQCFGKHCVSLFSINTFWRNT